MRSKFFLMLSLAAILLALPAVAADVVEDSKLEELAELDCAEAETLFATEGTPEMTPVVSPGIGGGPRILGCVAATCDDYPSTPWSTCSCSSQLIRERCQRSCDKKKGQVLETTCTINQGCPYPPCEIVPPTIRTSYSCARVQ